jgi:hypothetical protein
MRMVIVAGKKKRDAKPYQTRNAKELRPAI